MKKLQRILVIAIVSIICPLTGLAGILPNDLPTIEALIDQPKECMSAEDESNRQLAANASIKVDKKSNDALSYLALAAEMSRCVTNTVRLTNEYSEFTRFAADHLKGKPLVAWYAFEANYKVSKEIKNIRKLYLAVAASETQFFRATNKERMNIIWTLNQSITNMRDVIQQAYVWCDLLVGGYIHESHIWEIIDTSVLEEIGKSVIKDWPI